MSTTNRRSSSAHSADPTGFDEIANGSADWHPSESLVNDDDEVGSRALVQLPSQPQLPARLSSTNLAEAGPASSAQLPSWTDWVSVHASLPLRGLRPWASWLQRSHDNAVLAASLWSWSNEPLRTLDELHALQEASRHQGLQLLQQWAQSWSRLLQHQRSLGEPNTMSKWTEEQFNLLGQVMEMLSQQTADLANLEENISVNFGYWAQQRMNRRLGPI